MIIYALAGKAAESIRLGQERTAVYRFLQNPQKTDYKIAMSYVSMLSTSPAEQHIIIVNLFAKEPF